MCNLNNILMLDVIILIKLKEINTKCYYNFCDKKFLANEMRMRCTLAKQLHYSQSMPH